jgi:hypothetical protein
MKGNLHVRFCRRVQIARFVLSQRISLVTLYRKCHLGHLLVFVMGGCPFIERVSYGRQKEISTNGKQYPRKPDAAQARAVHGAKQTADEYYRPASKAYYRIPENGSFCDTRLAFGSPKMLQECRQFTRRGGIYTAEGPAFDRKTTERNLNTAAIGK